MQVDSVAVLEWRNIICFSCDWATCEQLHVNRDNIQQVVLLLLTFSGGAFHDPAWFTSPSFLE